MFSCLNKNTIKAPIHNESRFWTSHAVVAASGHPEDLTNPLILSCFISCCGKPIVSSLLCARVLHLYATDPIHKTTSKDINRMHSGLDEGRDIRGLRSCEDYSEWTSGFHTSLHVLVPAIKSDWMKCVWSWCKAVINAHLWLHILYPCSLATVL